MKAIIKMVAVPATAFSLAADTVVVPQDRETQSGNQDYIGGFANAAGGIQTVYGSQNFAGPVMITGIAFRANESGNSSFDTVIPTFTVRLTTYLGTVSSFVSGAYARNASADDTLVFSGPVHWVGQELPGSAPNPFDMRITFTTPFTYDPQRGMLLMNYSSSGATVGSTPAAADFHSHGNRQIGFIDSAGIETANLVTQFTFTPIPESETIMYLALGAVALSIRRGIKG